MSQLFSPDALVVPFEQLRMTDVEAVGGKNASLGEMIHSCLPVCACPRSFATTAHAFRAFLAYDGLNEPSSTPSWMHSIPKTCVPWHPWVLTSVRWLKPNRSG